ncbi:DEAD/DEAH box helicase [Kribbella sp. NPDC051586]|uniref:DEAD/DEAH box helicase n=1 Tax=Kribbella sp. NPDC051586 TaxID=3364118 RepID=UPI003799D97B
MLPEICDALDRVNIVEPFPIQEMTLPVALMGTDLIGQARTGTGKTLGFGIPLLQRTISPGEADYEELAAPGKPQALVVTPTRELTIQVAKDLTTASTVRTVRVLTIYGGVAYEPQLDALKNGVDVVVGTPGRLLDLANRGVLDLGHIKVLVLDEADEMLDLGFLPDVERILRKTPELRQTMLFSATMPSAVIGLARTHMRHPLNIRAESHEDTQMVPTTAQFVYRAHDLDKPEVVARILQADDRGRVMIFCRTKREASRLTDDLQDRGFKAAAIHGDLNQQARERALTRFRGDKIDVLVCTDVAARGIDVEGVTHVINNTCPEDEKTYIHRIGRTGRAGASGIAVTFVDWPDVTRWKVINKALDLPYEDPQEIYSTSPELYHDLGIPTDAKGRIRAAREQVRESRESREDAPRNRRGGSSERSEGRSDKGSEGRPEKRSESRPDGRADGDGARSGRKRNRTRKRTRAGAPVEELADVTTRTEVPPATEAAPTDAVKTDAVQTDAPQTDAVQDEARKPRKRTRTRKSADAPQAQAVEPAAEAEVAETPAEKPAKRTRTRKTAETVETAEAVEPQAAAEADVVEVAEKPVKRARTRKAAETKAPEAEATEPAAEADEKPVKRTRTRKTAAAKATEAAAETDAADEKPAKRTRKAAAKVAEPAAAEANADAAAEKPVKRARTRKAAEPKTAGPATTPIFSAPE